MFQAIVLLSKISFADLEACGHYFLQIGTVVKICLTIFFEAGVALTNIQIKLHPLQAQNNEKFTRFPNRLANIANENVQNRRRVLASYRDRRRVRLNQQFRHHQILAHSIELIE